MGVLSQVLFISLPEKSSLNLGNFNLDSTKLLPVDTGATPVDQWELGDLTWESIQAGMLKVFAWQPEHEDIGYYRDILFHLRPTINNELLQMALAKSKEREYTLAEELLLALKTLTDSDPFSLLNLAVLYEAWGRHIEQLDRKEESKKYFNQAKSYFQRAIDSGKAPKESYYMAGLFYYSQGDYSYAHSLLMSFVDKTDDQDSRKEKAKRMTQEILLLQQKKDLYLRAFKSIEADENIKGIELIKNFLKTSPESWNGWFLLGWGQRKQQLWQEALDCFIICQDLQGDNADLLNEMALCSMELSQYKKAQDFLEKALHLNSSDLRILSNLAILMMKMDKKERAVEYFQQVLGISPEDPLALQYLEYLNQ
ncbi:MAG: hypothetical protein PF447_00570 [Spirochaetaceae bacterium]|jgi:tetratricopeptide (TPR) repeat protein|nr:hypothetical protein [Spirochaetaceae bacterium]